MKRTYISREIRKQVTQDAQHRCGYCLSEEILTGMPLCIEHIIPLAAGGTSLRENMWMACHPCNEFKNERVQSQDPETDNLVPLFNPRTQRWTDHFKFDASRTFVIGLTPMGRATLALLQMNRPLLVKARKRWVMSGWPAEIE